MLGLPLNNQEENNYDSTDLQRYGLGNVRSFQLYLEIFGINLNSGEIYNHCPEAFAGLLHDRLHAFLRSDGRGISYDWVYIKEKHGKKLNEINNNHSNQQNKNNKQIIENIAKLGGIGDGRDINLIKKEKENIDNVLGVGGMAGLIEKQKLKQQSDYNKNSQISKGLYHRGKLAPKNKS